MFDATVIDLEDRFEDALAETIPPSDLPALDLPDYEPTSADLLAVETWAEERLAERLDAKNTGSAFEARHRELLVLRDQMLAEDRWEADRAA